MVPTNHAPFNSSSKRFDKITIHPKLDTSGVYVSRPPACDPCLYTPILIQNYCSAIHKKAIDKDPWRYKVELEEWAKNLGYRNQKILKQRLWDRSLLGPAWHDVKEPAHYEAACPNVLFGRTSRSKRPTAKDFLPGPGTYFRSTSYKAPNGPHSTRPSFEREEPCRFKNMTPNWCLAPDRYVIVDKESIAEKSNKLVSLRGPYDLFTGKRDVPPKNHFNNKPSVSSSTWPIALPGSLERYKKTRLGVMNKTSRDIPFKGRMALVDVSMCVRKPEDPSPAEYTIEPPRVFKKNRYGFNSSYDRPRGYKRCVVWPGIGRYNTVLPRAIVGDGHRHVFVSKVRRGVKLPEKMNSF